MSTSAKTVLPATGSTQWHMASMEQGPPAGDKPSPLASASSPRIRACCEKTQAGHTCLHGSATPAEAAEHPHEHGRGLVARVGGLHHADVLQNVLQVLALDVDKLLTRSKEADPCERTSPWEPRPTWHA